MTKSFVKQFMGAKLRIALRCFGCGTTRNVHTFGKMDWCSTCEAQARARGGLK